MRPNANIDPNRPVRLDAMMNGLTRRSGCVENMNKFANGRFSHH
jgi:hypothetical protein